MMSTLTNTPPPPRGILFGLFVHQQIYAKSTELMVQGGPEEILLKGNVGQRSKTGFHNDPLADFQ